MKLTLERRPCLIGPAINSRREKHGEELKTAMDIPLKSIMLSADELATLCADKFIHAALFNESGALTEPNLQCFEPPFVLKGKYEAPLISLELGLKPELIAFENVTLKRLELTPMTGGLCALDVLVQCIPELDHGITTLLGFIGKDGHVELTIGEAAPDSKQRELPMSIAGGDSPPAVAEERKRRRGRPAKNSAVTH